MSFWRHSWRPLQPVAALSSAGAGTVEGDAGDRRPGARLVAAFHRAMTVYMPLVVTLEFGDRVALRIGPSIRRA